MSKGKKWNILNKVKNQKSKVKTEELLQIILENRGLKTNEEIENFLHPKLKDVTADAVGIEKKELTKTLQRIQEAIDKKEQIVIFGDYDVDGITATAILWETLYALGASVVPYIPGRIEEGYGLSTKGIFNLQLQISNIKLIITVDNGIVANEAVDFANRQGIDVIVTDHHTRGEQDPNAYAIVHTTKLCGAGVSWLLSQEIFNFRTKSTSPRHGGGAQFPISNEKKNSKIKNNVIASDSEAISSMQKQITRNGIALSSRHAVTPRNDEFRHLELVCLATIADLVPLTGANRTLVLFGLEALHNTQRVGLHALFTEAGVDQETIGVYEIGHIIAPRLNAMGRMASAMDSLRLLCTKDPTRARVLADTLGRTNRDRQLLTQEMATHAIESIKYQEASIKNILFVAHETYEQGVIGLVASKLVETYYRPSIVLSIGEKITKASARSISGFNIIEFIRTSSHLLVNAGGHPMAAGFTVETEKLKLLQEAMELLAQDVVTEDMLVRSIKIDCELPLSVINDDMYEAIQTLQPFGMANAEPLFATYHVEVDSIRAIGAEKRHLKLTISQNSHPRADRGSINIDSRLRGNDKERSWDNNGKMDAVAFGFGELINDIHVGDKIDVAYTIDENVWNGRKNLQLKIRDIKVNAKLKDQNVK